MIEQELILLGLLRERPKHGYEIKKELQEMSSLFAGVDSQSIYYPLQALEKKRLLIKSISKKGNRPMRFVYKLTPEGKKYFLELLAKSFLYFRKPQFSLDLSLYFLQYIQPEVAKRKLRARIRILNKLAKDLGQLIKSLRKKNSMSLCYISEHNLQMVETEAKFLTDLVKTL